MSHTFTSFLSVHNDDTIRPCHTPLHLSYQFITTTQYAHVTHLYIFLSVHNDDTIRPCHTPLHLSYQFITTTQYAHVTHLYIFLISS